MFRFRAEFAPLARETITPVRPNMMLMDMPMQKKMKRTRPEYLVMRTSINAPIAIISMEKASRMRGDACERRKPSTTSPKNPPKNCACGRVDTSPLVRLKVIAISGMIAPVTLKDMPAMNMRQ